MAISALYAIRCSHRKVEQESISVAIQKKSNAHFFFAAMLLLLLLLLLLVAVVVAVVIWLTQQRQRTERGILFCMGLIWICHVDAGGCGL